MTSVISTKKPKTTKSKTFHIGMIVPLTPKKNADFFLKSIEALCELGFKVHTLAEGDSESQRICFQAMKKYPHQFEILESTPKNKRKIIESSNIMLFPSLPNENILQEIQKRGIIPIIEKSKKFQDFDPQKESGNAFTFESNNFWQFFTAIIRASENFKFSYDWKNLQKNLKETSL